MGLVIKTDNKGVKVWRNDRGQYPSYSYSISRKTQDGKWETTYRSIQFKKGVELENGTNIIIDNAFESFDSWEKDGKTFKRDYLMVTDFRKMDGDDFIDIPDQALEDELPFV